MKLLVPVEQSEQTTSYCGNNNAIETQLPSSSSSSPPSAWYTSLSTLGWPVSTLDTISTIQAARGPGFLGAAYPNVLTVLKAGPAHAAATKMVRVLATLAGDGGEGANKRNGHDAVPLAPRSWSDLAHFDECVRLSSQLDAMIAQGAGWYATAAVVAFQRARAARDVKRLRAAYCAVAEAFLERWLWVKAVRVAVKRVEDDRQERERVAWPS